MRRSRTAHVRIPLSVPPLPSDGLRRAALWERAGIIKECVGENVSTHHTDRGAAAASCFRVAETMVTGGAAVARLPLPVSVAGDEFSKRHHTGTSRSTALQHEDPSSTATIVNDGSTDAAEKPPTTSTTGTSATDTTATTAEEIATDGSKVAGDIQAVESTNAADEPATPTSTADTPSSEASAAEKKKAKKEKRKQIQKERREERARSMSRGEERLHRLGQCADTVKYLGPDGVALFESQRGASKWGRAAFILVSAPKHHTHEFHEAVSESLRERNAVAERAYAAAVADFNRTHGTHGQGGRVADNGKSGKKKHQKDKSAREVKQLSATASAIEAALQMDAVTPPAAVSVDTATTASNADTETTPVTSTSDSVTAEPKSEESSVDQSTHADGGQTQEVGGDATAPVPTEPFVFPELRLLNVKSYTKAYIAFFAKASAPIDSRRTISSFFSTAERLSAAGLIDVSGRNAGGCTANWLKSPREKDSESVGDTHATSPATNGDGETASDVAASAETKNDERRATFEMLFTRKMKRELANAAAAAAEKKFKQSKKVDTVRGKAKGKGDRMRGMNVATKSHVASVFTGLPVPAFGHTNAQRKARALAESQRRAALNKDSHRRGSKDTKTTGKHTQKSTGKSSDENDNEKVGSTKTTADVGTKEYPVDPGLLGPSKFDCLVAWAESLGPLMAPVPSQVHQYRSPEHMSKCGLDGNSEGTSDVPGPALSETFDTPRWKQFDRRDRTHEATTDHNAVSTAATEFDELLDAAADAANCDVALMWRGVAPNAPATPNGSEDPHVNVDNAKGESEEDEGKEAGVTNVRHHNVTVFLVPRGAKGAKDGEKSSGPRTFQIKSNGAEGDGTTTAGDASGPGTTDSSSSSPLPPTSTSSAGESVAPKARVQAFLAGLVTVKPSGSVVQLQHPSHRSVYRASLVFSGASARQGVSNADSTASSTTIDVDEGEHAPVSGENPDGEKPQQEVVDLEMKIVVLQSKKSGAVPQGLGAAALLQASPSALHTAALTAAAQRSKLRFQTCGLVDAAGDVVATPTVEDAMAVLGLKAGLDIKM